MTIVHVFRNLMVGGNQILALDLIRSMEKSFDHIVVSMFPWDETSDRFREAGFKVLIGSSSDRSKARIWLGSTLEELARAKPKPVMLSWFFPFTLRYENLFAGAIHHLGTAPTPITPIILVRFLLSSLRKKGSQQSTIVVPSQHVSDCLRKMPIPRRTQIKVIPNGIDLKSFRRLSERRQKETQVVTMIGRLDGSKRFDLFLQLAARFPSKHVEFWVVGGGVEKDALEDKARRYGAANAKFLGRSDDIPSVLSQTDVFCFFPKPKEGFGLVFVEALAAGCPVLTTKVGPGPEIIRDGLDGFIVRDIKEAERRLVEILSSAKLLESLSRNAVNRAKDFDVHRTAEKYERLVRQVKSASSRPTL